MHAHYSLPLFRRFFHFSSLPLQLLLHSAHRPPTPPVCRRFSSIVADAAPPALLPPPRSSSCVRSLSLASDRPPRPTDRPTETEDESRPLPTTGDGKSIEPPPCESPAPGLTAPPRGICRRTGRLVVSQLLCSCRGRLSPPSASAQRQRGIATIARRRSAVSPSPATERPQTTHKTACVARSPQLPFFDDASVSTLPPPVLLQHHHAGGRRTR